MKMKDPFLFLTAEYEGPKTFYDRERETAELIVSIENNRNTTLIAPRRYGKMELAKMHFQGCCLNMTRSILLIFMQLNICRTLLRCSLNYRNEWINVSD